ncbi:MAG: hypothetical protein M1824_003777 [Vezdaea acicularis]|nr:MAG: hypothetical protein M1824_003777 [Vezdaea acicularis]
MNKDSSVPTPLDAPLPVRRSSKSREQLKADDSGSYSFQFTTPGIKPKGLTNSTRTTSQIFPPRCASSIREEIVEQDHEVATSDYNHSLPSVLRQSPTKATSRTTAFSPIYLTSSICQEMDEEYDREAKGIRLGLPSDWLRTSIRTARNRPQRTSEIYGEEELEEWTHQRTPDICEADVSRQQMEEGCIKPDELNTDLLQESPANSSINPRLKARPSPRRFGNSITDNPAHNEMILAWQQGVLEDVFSSRNEEPPATALLARATTFDSAMNRSGFHGDSQDGSTQDIKFSSFPYPEYDSEDGMSESEFVSHLPKFEEPEPEPSIPGGQLAPPSVLPNLDRLKLRCPEAINREDSWLGFIISTAAEDRAAFRKKNTFPFTQLPEHIQSRIMSLCVLRPTLRPYHYRQSKHSLDEDSAAPYVNILLLDKSINGRATQMLYQENCFFFHRAGDLRSFLRCVGMENRSLVRHIAIGITLRLTPAMCDGDPLIEELAIPVTATNEEECLKEILPIFADVDDDDLDAAVTEIHKEAIFCYVGAWYEILAFLLRYIPPWFQQLPTYKSLIEMKMIEEVDILCGWTRNLETLELDIRNATCFNGCHDISTSLRPLREVVGLLATENIVFVSVGLEGAEMIEAEASSWLCDAKRSIKGFKVGSNAQRGASRPIK